jgi:hypothetical protein
MNLDDIEERIYQLKKSRESKCPGTASLEKMFFLEFIQHVAKVGQDQIKAMAGCILSQYHPHKIFPEKEYNICQDAMNQIEKDAFDGTLIFEQDDDQKILRGTNVWVVYDKTGFMIKKFERQK